MYNSNFLLVHNNCIIEEDESSINFISDDGTIIIIEDRIYPDDFYYNSLIELSIKENLLSIKVDSTNPPTYLDFPYNITYLEMKKAIHLKFGYDKKNLKLESKYIVKDNDIINNIYHILCKGLSFNIAGKGLLGTSINVYGKKIEC